MNVANKIAFYNNTNEKLVTIHNNGIRIWDVDYQQKKILFQDLTMGQVKRQYQCIVITPDDQSALLGTLTGDIVEINLERRLYKRVGPGTLFSQGIKCMQLLANGDLLVGAGDGTIAKIQIGGPTMKIKSKDKIMGACTSISCTADSTHFFAGSDKATIYWCNSDTIAPELRNTCHYARINDISFPAGYSDLFATCSINDIRVWNAKTRQELLRIEVPGLECYAVRFMNDGRSILSGWSDGKIRSFLPQSGRLLFAINDAHNHGVTALAPTNDCQRIVSGGMEGEVRIWQIGQ